MKTLAQALAQVVGSRNICEDRGNIEWQYKHEHKIEMLMDKLPSGSGIDNENNINLGRSTGEKLVISSAFHVMDDAGYYSGWVDFRVIVTASLQHGFNLNIVGNFSSNKNAFGIKDYLYEVYDDALSDAA